MTRDANRRRASRTSTNARSAPATTPGSRHASASRPVSMRSAEPGPSATRESPAPSTPRLVAAVGIAANGDSPWTSTTTTRPSAIT